MIGRFIQFWDQPTSRRYQRLAFAWWAIVTRLWFAPRMVYCGKGSIIGSPLFITPEFMSVGVNVLIWPKCRIEGISIMANLRGQVPLVEIGDNVVMQQHCHITAIGHLYIGTGTLMSFNVSIQDTDHSYEDILKSVSQQPLIFKKTFIGENCFIGARVSIQAGTHLGRHCIVGANAVVKGTFPDYCVLVGAPARIVKRYDLEHCLWRRTDLSGNFLPDLD